MARITEYYRVISGEDRIRDLRARCREALRRLQDVHAEMMERLHAVEHELVEVLAELDKIEADLRAGRFGAETTVWREELLSTPAFWWSPQTVSYPGTQIGKLLLEKREEVEGCKSKRS